MIEKQKEFFFLNLRENPNQIVIKHSKMNQILALNHVMMLDKSLSLSLHLYIYEIIK